MITSFLLLAIGIAASPVAAFMPNYVFSFRPPNRPTPPGGGPELPELPGVEIAAGFLPSDFYPVEETEGPLHDGSWTHKDIIRRACLNVVARFYEETTPRLAPGDVTGLSRLTPASLLRVVFGPDASSAKFERAIEEIEIAAARMDQWYEVNATLDEAANIARAHFDDEQFHLGQRYLLRLRRQMFAAVQKEALSAARDLAGRFMLTLQDFYAHSNYVELGRTEPLKELGKTPGASFLSTVAGADETVCTDCTRPLYRDASCRNNIATTTKLTSGYFFYPTDIVNYDGGAGKGRVKPTGKCSYGDEADQSAQLSALGGINKSTRNSRKSPHFYLHETAAQLAVKATEEFLEGIRDVVGDDAFLRFFSLGRTVGGGSLCFVIDQSGSMRDDIAAAKERAKQIVRTTTTQPFNYVLVQFVDYDKFPAFGPPFVTQDPDDFIAELEKLSADGGGDCPELAMNGMHLALTNSLPGSSLYVFTDAGAGDCSKTNTILSLIDSKNTIVNFFYTGPSTPCGSCPDDFNTIATQSGGQLLSVDKASVDKATQLAELTAEASLVVLLSAATSDSTGIYRFPVDCTIRKLVISLSGLNPTANIVQPDGTDFTSTDDLLLDRFLLINVTDPMVGLWTINASFSDAHSIIVRASSSVGFDFNFVTVAGRPGHLGVFPINGRPIVDTLTKVVLNVDGLDRTNDTNGFMVDLIDRMGKAIESHEPEQGFGYSTNLLGFAFVAPSTPFRLRLRGADRCDGDDIVRVSPTETTAQTLAFASADSNLENVIEPGGFTNATFVLHNSGRTDDITVAYNDEQGFGESISVTLDEPITTTKRRRRRRGLSDITHTFTLEANRSATVTIRYGAPTSAEFGQSNTATLTASTSGGETFNYVSFQVVVTPDEQDETPPTCRVVERTTCAGVAAVDCGAYRRIVRAEVRDVGIGLQSIRARQRGVDVDFDFASGTNETVNVTATSSCCYLAIDLESSDVVGNLQSSGCSAVIPPGVANDEIALLGILIPDGTDEMTGVGIVRIVVEDWKTIYYSVNVTTDVVPMTFRLSETRNKGVGDPLFTVSGFNYGNVLFGSLPVDGSYLPIIYGKTAYGTVQYDSNGIRKSIGGQILYVNLPAAPHYEALLTCRSRSCAVGGYVALTLDGPNSTYYLLVGGANVSTAHLMDPSGNVVAQMNGGIMGSSPGEGAFQLSINQRNQLLEGELTVTVRTSDGNDLTGRLRAPWMPTSAPTTPAPTTPSSSVSAQVSAVTFIVCVVSLLFLY